MTLKLDPRLQAVADSVRPGSRVADIGCDHGLVVAHLILSGTCSSAIASDVAEGPLRAAGETLARLKVPDVRLVRGDGLAQIAPNAVDDIIIAGMGGELIADILARAPGFHRADKRFVLQPMTRLYKLRQFLILHGFVIVREHAVVSHGKPYSVMTCAFAGDVKPCHPAYAYIGELKPQQQEAAAQLLRRQRDELLKKQLAGAADAADMGQLIQSMDIALSGGDPYGT